MPTPSLPRTLVLGAHGQLGKHLGRALGASCIAVTRSMLDLRDGALAEMTARLIAAHAPEYVVNAAAFTDVAGAEKDDGDARIVNGLAPGILARVCREHKLPFLQLSTDYVFDGHKATGYLESDTPHPLNRYGASKYEGEQNVLLHHPAASVARVSWLYDAEGKNFFTMMHGLAKSQSELRIVADQIGIPTYAGEAARMVVDFMALHVAGHAPSGIYHFSPDGHASWHEFACAILPDFHPITPIRAAEYSTHLARPACSRLDNRKIKALGMATHHWRAGLAACLKEYRHAAA